ncbi:MAG: DUF4197 domain-containing protein [Novosphingobium sp.]|nr:DUF4197 domain-containing protein [Novosphingobium sp.]
MERSDAIVGRRNFVAGLVALAGGLALAPGARAAGLGGSLSSILGKASDSALDRLAVPGAFYNDPAIRIGLPLIGGSGGLLGTALSAGNKLGVLDGLTRKLNDAAGVAAGEAKPIFRNAINNLSLNDVPGIVSHNDGATRYLRQSSGDMLHDKLRPLIDGALGDLGAYTQLDKLTRKHSFLASAGISRDGLGKSVTDQAMGGIFSYIGSEEASLRANPLGKAGGLLKGVLGN